VIETIHTALRQIANMVGSNCIKNPPGLLTGWIGNQSRVDETEIGGNRAIIWGTLALLTNCWLRAWAAG
jgi:hypothetical protein